jgi:hypothetical protein
MGGFSARNEKKGLGWRLCSLLVARFSEPARRPVLLEAVPAVHRLSFSRLERHLACLSAVSANCVVHFAWSAKTASAVSPVFKSHSSFTYFSPIAASDYPIVFGLDKKRFDN